MPGISALLAFVGLLCILIPVAALFYQRHVSTRERRDMKRHLQRIGLIFDSEHRTRGCRRQIYSEFRPFHTRLTLGGSCGRGGQVSRKFPISDYSSITPQPSLRRRPEQFRVT